MCSRVLLLCALGLLQLADGVQLAAHSRASIPTLRSLLSSAPTGVCAEGAPRLATRRQRHAAARCVATVRPEVEKADAVSTAAPATAAAPAEGKAGKGGKKKGDKGKQAGGGQATVHGQPLVIGLSHKTATVEVREKLSITEDKWNEAAASLVSFDSIQEASVLSTCNRFEVYIVATDHFAATRDVMAFLSGHSGLDEAQLRPNLFMLRNEDAVYHLLRVSAGLDSLVIGEGQILSQVKACYSHAIAGASEDEPAGSAGKVLSRLLNTAVMSGKFVRSETQIAKGAVSISSAAVELAVLKAPEDLGMPLADARVVVVGAGKMSRLLLTHLASHGVTKLTLLNRSRPRAEELAAEYPDLEIDVGLMDRLWPALAESDMAFTSTSATGCIVTQPELAAKGWADDGASDLVLIDISVPRNVESECNDLEPVHAYNVDDLKQVVAANQARRRKKVLEAEVLLRAELAKFTAWQESLRYVPAISDLQRKFEAVREAELKKASKKLKNLGDKERQAVETLTKGIINKLMHAPMSYLRSDDLHGDKATVDQVHELFKLDQMPR